MKSHQLKTWPQYFAALCDGSKTFEARLNDRDFAVGDELVLREWDPVTEKFSGAFLEMRVTYILRGPAFGVADGFCVMAVRR